MATGKDRRRNPEEASLRKDDDLVDATLEALAESEELPDDAELDSLVERIEEPGLQDRILERYLSHGKRLLSDDLPTRLDPRIAKRLEPLLGDVGDVRVHTGKVATAAAQAMDARAFAIGDGDVFVDASEFRPDSIEGGALLAHEVAHTRDAATGFALSSRRGSSSDREAFAEAIELEYAREEALDSAPVPTDADRQPYTSTAANRAPEPKFDKVLLTERIYQILKSRERRSSEREGR